MTETAPASTPVRTPDLAGTFAVYLFPDGSAGLVLDIQESAIGATGETRHQMPKFVVDMVLYGKRPNPLTMFRMMGGPHARSDADPDRTE